MSRTTKSTGKINFSTFTKTSSTIPHGYLMDLSASCNDIVVGLGSPSPNFLKSDKGNKLILALESHKTLEKEIKLIVQGIVKLPGSLSF